MAEYYDDTPKKADQEYAARENGLQAAIKAVKEAHTSGIRDATELHALGAKAYHIEYDATMAAYRVAYSVHDIFRREYLK